MSVPQRYALGAIRNSDKLALRLVTNHYVDISKFENIKNQKRAFNIYQWRTDLIDPGGKIFSGWAPYLHYGKQKWSRYDRELRPDQLEGPVLMQAHKFFQTFKEFKKWVGETNYKDLIADLL